MISKKFTKEEFDKYVDEQVQMTLRESEMFQPQKFTLDAAKHMAETIKSEIEPMVRDNYFKVTADDHIIENVHIAFAKGKDSSKWPYGVIHNDPSFFTISVHPNVLGAEVKGRISYELKKSGMAAIRAKKGPIEAITGHIVNYFKKNIELMKNPIQKEENPASETLKLEIRSIIAEAMSRKNTPELQRRIEMQMDSDGNIPHDELIELAHEYGYLPEDERFLGIYQSAMKNFHERENEELKDDIEYTIHDEFGGEFPASFQEFYAVFKNLMFDNAYGENEVREMYDGLTKDPAQLALFSQEPVVVAEDLSIGPKGELEGESSQEMEKVATFHGYDYYVGIDMDGKFYNVVPVGSLPPTSGYRSKEYLMHVKKVGDMFGEKETHKHPVTDEGEKQVEQVAELLSKKYALSEIMERNLRHVLRNHIYGTSNIDEVVRAIAAITGASIKEIYDEVGQYL